jgi:hypothetical protein
LIFLYEAPKIVLKKAHRATTWSTETVLFIPRFKPIVLDKDIKKVKGK